jgi:hypothetical protein
MALWVKGKTSQHIVVMDNRVQRIFAIEAKAGQVEGNWMGQKSGVNRKCQMLRPRILPLRYVQKKT